MADYKTYAEMRALAILEGVRILQEFDFHCVLVAYENHLVLLETPKTVPKETEAALNKLGWKWNTEFEGWAIYVSH